MFIICSAVLMIWVCQKSKNISKMLTEGIQKAHFYNVYILKNKYSKYFHVSNKVIGFFFIYLYQYQNLGVNLEKLYNIMMDLADGLKVRHKKNLLRNSYVSIELKRVNDLFLIQISIIECFSP